MAVDTTVPRSRRALLGAALGAVAATAAQAVGRPLAARAEGETIVVGGEYATATSRTRLVNVTNNADVIRAESSSGNALVGASGSGVGVVGTSNTNHGIKGTSSAYGTAGVFGHSTVVGGQGVYGDNFPESTQGALGGAEGVSGIHHDDGTGVYGQSLHGIGVHGHTSSTGGETIGVLGVSRSPDGYGVRGLNTAGSGGAGVAGFAEGTFGQSAGVLGQVASPDGYGVLGDTLSTATSARAIVGHAPAGTGVLGWAGSGTAPAGKTRTGVYGRATGSTNARGVYGYSTAGVGVYAEATTGSALRVVGKATFSRSGKLTIPANQKSATKTGVALTSSSLVLVVLQSNRAGVYVQAAVPNVGGSSFTVHLNKVASTTVGTTVAWLIVN